jgi:hypothetical protein
MSSLMLTLASAAADTVPTFDPRLLFATLGALAVLLGLILLAWVLAAVVRALQGSATVAMLTAAGFMAPVTQQLGLSDHLLAIFVISLSSGATVLSHVNDSGFWMIIRYLGMSEKQMCARGPCSKRQWASPVWFSASWLQRWSDKNPPFKAPQRKEDAVNLLQKSRVNVSP